MGGFLFGRWKLGEGVVLLRFLWCWFRKVSDVSGVVLRCQKGQGQDEADGNPVLLVRQRHCGVQLADRIEQSARLAAA